LALYKSFTYLLTYFDQSEALTHAFGEHNTPFLQARTTTE